MTRLRDWFDRSRSWSVRRQIGFGLLVALLAGGLVGSITRRDPIARTSTTGVPLSLHDAPSTSTDGLPLVTTPQVGETVAPTTEQPSASTGLLDSLAVLETISIGNEHQSGYNRDLFAVWSDLDHDGCDTRVEVLVSESVGPTQVDPYGCTVLAGIWYSRYDGLTLTDTAELDVDHLVSLKEAWDSGAWDWTPDRRIAYGNDLTDSRSLVVVSAESNAEKGQKDPSNWLPTTDDVCHFISDWIAVKARWAMTMDQSEWGRLHALLTDECLGATLETWGRPPA